MRPVAVALALLLMQAAASSPLRVGPTAGYLTARDVERISQVVAGPDRPAVWLLDARSTGFIPGWHVAVHLDADKQTAQLRRGRVVYVRATTAEHGVYRATGDWTAGEVQSWAQVPGPGPDPRVVIGSRDLARPFGVAGVFSDDELVGIVAFIRRSPENTDRRPLTDAFRRVRGDWPITGISRDGAFVRIMLLDEKAREDTGQGVWLERTGDGWVVRRITFWVID